MNFLRSKDVLKDVQNVVKEVKRLLCVFKAFFKFVELLGLYQVQKLSDI